MCGPAHVRQQQWDVVAIVFEYGIVTVWLEYYVMQFHFKIKYNIERYIN